MSFAMPVRASLMPSIRPSTPAVERSVTVTNVGRIDVVISWPESLKKLANPTPATPLEVMTGKIVPYILIGLLQVTIVLTLAQWLFGVPMLGGYATLYLSVLLFIAANLMLGLTLSSIAQNQLQAMQMTFFFFLPSILLSGFMFPFRGMPEWAQYIGQALPLTHFLRIVRGVLLKGNGFSEVLPEMWPIAVFMLAVIAVGLRFFRSTLD